MGLMSGKKGLIFGVANDHSIAWGIAERLHAEGAELGFTHLPDKDPAMPRMERRVRKLAEPIGAKYIGPCNVQVESDVDTAFSDAAAALGGLDFVLHSIAYAPIEDLKADVSDVSRAGFLQAMEISCYSLISVTQRAKKYMTNGGAIVTLTYLGGERVIPGYNIMGVCKAALESTTEYLAAELGQHKIRVNAISAGPIRTLSSSAVKGIDQMLDLYDGMAPLRRNVETEEVGKSALYLLSDLATGVTGETLHVDAGFHVMGAPPHDFKMGTPAAS